MTAAERRASGEREFCACPVCYCSAYGDLRALATQWLRLTSTERERVAALLRALVVQALLTGWGEP